MRLLLLMPTTTYRADAFVAAAEKMGVEIVFGSDRCHVLDEKGIVVTTRDSLVLDFLEPEISRERIAEYACRKPIDGVIAVDDATTVIAALASEKLGLPHNPVESARASRDKRRMRELFARGGVRQARFRDLSVAMDPKEAAHEAARDPGFPCVIKPRMLSGSRGVMRADDEASFATAFARLARILGDPEVKARGGESAKTVLVESFVPGREVALEGILRGGALEVLALFDKPDPLDGPFFEETYYVTPSRLPEATQERIVAEVVKAARALGLVEGPLHAELRVNDEGAFVLEIAARSIGGLCSRTLRFGSGMSLEEVLIRHAIARPVPPASPSATESGGGNSQASGVLMIPIPRSGVFRGVGNLDAARAVPGIEEITITAIEGRDLLALPEGCSYLGFAFARSTSPGEVEAALRAAHRTLEIRIAASLAKAP